MDPIEAEEEARAQAYRDSLTARQAFRKALAARLLVTDTAPYDELVANWQPLISLIREGNQNAGNTKDYIDEQHKPGRHGQPPVWREID